jgi:hypothetical protein
MTALSSYIPVLCKGQTVGGQRLVKFPLISGEGAHFRELDERPAGEDAGPCAEYNFLDGGFRIENYDDLTKDAQGDDVAC